MTQARPLEEQQLLEMERAALTRWCNGDPDGFLEISAPDIVYFDPYRAHRIDGLPALRQICDELRGKVFAERFEILNPRIQWLGSGAVLTFNFVSWGADGSELRWNCTEIYQKGDDGLWRIIQTHWSYTWPPPKGYAQAT